MGGIQLVDLGPGGGKIKLPPVPSPKVYTNFADPTKFVVIAQPEITLTFDGVGRLTLAGNAAPDGNFYPAIAGVRLNATVFPAWADGEMEWNVTFDQYINASDIAAGRNWLACVILQMAGGQNANASMLYFQGYGMKTGGLQAQAWNGQFSINSSQPPVNVSGGDANVPTSFTMAGKISLISNAGVMQWCISKYLLNRDVGPNMGLDPIPYNASNNVPQKFFGVKFMAGIVYESKSALGTARLTNLTISKGVIVEGYESL